VGFHLLIFFTLLSSVCCDVGSTIFTSVAGVLIGPPHETTCNSGFLLVVHGWSEKFSASTIDGNTVSKIFSP
jgi:hypothetical protein